MFFRRSKKENADDTPQPTTTASPDKASSEERASTARKPLAASELRRAVDVKSLDFKTTADLEPASRLIGQNGAFDAIERGAKITARSSHIAVIGPPGSGRTTVVMTALAGAAAQAPAPYDWAYVCNYDDPHRPKALKLPAGRARRLARCLVDAIDELRVTIPATFDGDDYRSRRRAIEEEFRSGQELALETLQGKAAAQNIAILRTPLGFGVAPMHDGKVVKADVFSQLPESLRRDVETRVSALQRELETALAEAPKADKRRRQQLSELSTDVARVAVEAALEDVKAEFADATDVVRHLSATERDLLRNIALFLEPQKGESDLVKLPADVLQNPAFHRFMVNVIVEHAGPGGTGTGAPIYEEVNPTLGNFMGSAGGPSLAADHFAIKSGALHRANGGYLIIDARALLGSVSAWPYLKRALKRGEITIESASPASPEPEPIPLDVKVVLVADHELLTRRLVKDPDFGLLFSVQAELASDIARNTESEAAYGLLIAAIVARHKLRPVEASGVALLIEEASRMAGDRDKLSIAPGALVQIISDADFRAGSETRDTIGRSDIVPAIAVRRRSHGGGGDQGDAAIDTEGQKVGQINSLTLVAPDDLSPGRASRVTARVRPGGGKAGDIVRDVFSADPSTKAEGGAALWGYLAGQFASEVPLALSASVAVEGPIAETSRASLAELVALLSALGEVPIRQDLAVAGAVNQLGEVDSTGGGNERIEAFFDVCVARGLSKTQGVLVPHRDARRLMLREDVVEAVSTDRFAVYAVSTVAEAVELLTGLKAGERRADGLFPAGSVNRLVEDKLKAFAGRAHKPDRSVRAES